MERRGPLTTAEVTDVGCSTARCPNCSAELADQYCSRCGQRRIQPEELSVRHFLHELADEVTDSRTKFKTLRTPVLLLTIVFNNLANFAAIRLTLALV
jgi:hypothetical protein